MPQVRVRNALKYNGVRCEPGSVVDIDANVLATLPPGTVTALQPKAELRTDGPTIEVYVAAGYAAENYPPQGYAEVWSPGLEKFRQEQKAATKQAAIDRVRKVAGAPATTPVQGASPAAGGQVGDVAGAAGEAST